MENMSFEQNLQVGNWQRTGKAFQNLLVIVPSMGFAVGPVWVQSPTLPFTSYVVLESHLTSQGLSSFI